MQKAYSTPSRHFSSQIFSLADQHNIVEIVEGQRSTDWQHTQDIFQAGLIGPRLLAESEAEIHIESDNSQQIYFFNE